MAFNAHINTFYVADIAERDAIADLAGPSIAIILDIGGGVAGISHYNGDTWLTPITFSQSGAENGLTLAGSNIRLGGTLDAPTAIAGGGHSFAMTNLSLFSINTDALQVGANGIGVNVPISGGVVLNVQGSTAAKKMQFLDSGTLIVTSDQSTPFIFTGTSSIMQMQLSSSAGTWYQYIASDGAMSFRPSGFGTPVFRMDLGASLTDQLRLNADGSITLAGYGSNNFNDTPAYILGVTEGGQIVETESTAVQSINDLTDGYTNATSVILGHAGGSTGANDIRNTAVGIGALVSMDNTTALDNTAVGYNALNLSVNADKNTAVGSLALAINTTGNWNTVVGADAMRSNQTSLGNVAIGMRALELMDSGAYNVAVGQAALGLNLAGFRNTAVGRESLLQFLGDETVAYGYRSGHKLTTGGDNTIVGYTSMFNSTTAARNTVLGKEALYYNEAGADNIAIGYMALYRASDTTTPTSFYNIAIGIEALHGSGSASANTGSRNIVFGYRSAYAYTTASENIIIGHQAAESITTHSQNILIGNDIDQNGNDYLNIANAIYGSLGTYALNQDDADLSIDGIWRVRNKLFVATTDADNALNNVLVIDPSGEVKIRTAASIATAATNTGIFDSGNWWQSDIDVGNIPLSGFLDLTVPSSGINSNADFWMFYEDNGKTYYYIGDNGLLLPTWAPVSRPSVVYRGFNNFLFEDITTFSVTTENGSVISLTDTIHQVDVNGETRINIPNAILSVAGPQMGSYWSQTIGVHGGTGASNARPGFAVSTTKASWTAPAAGYYMGDPADETTNAPATDNTVDQLVGRNPVTGQVLLRDVSSITRPPVEWRQSTATGIALLVTQQRLALTTDNGNGTIFTDSSGDIAVNAATYADIGVSMTVVANGQTKTGIQIELYDAFNVQVLHTAVLNIPSSSGEYPVSFRHMGDMAGTEILSLRFTNAAIGIRVDDIKFNIRN